MNNTATLLKNAHVYNGLGFAPYPADILINNGFIEQILSCGTYQANNNTKIIDLNGLALAPGFIDVHTHDDRQIMAAPDMWPKLSQGVTTVIAGNCGISLAPWAAPEKTPPAPLTLIGQKGDFRYATIESYWNEVVASKPAVHLGTLIGHSTLRIAAMQDTNQAASEEDLARMCASLEAAMKAGALGMSSGLFYKPSQAAPNSEVIKLLKVVSKNGGVYTSHIRDEYDKVLDSLNEACDAGEQSMTPVVLSHHKCAGPSNWGRTVETLALVAQRQSTHPIRIDAYPYTAGSTVLDPEYVDGIIRIMLCWSTTHPEMAGRDLADIATEWGVDQKEAARRLHPAGAVYFQMHEDDVRRVLSFPHTMIGSDGLPHDQHPHPRLWGAFTRMLGYYSREEQLMNLPEAIRRMTSLSADTFGLHKRGRIAVGCAADLVAFNPETVIDKATFENPCQASEGIIHVWVEGVQSVENGQATGLRNGRVLKRHEEKYS